MSVSYKDYYKILGVDKKADERAIKSAYRRLAKKYHPDVNKESGAEERYKDINEAYEVLSDPQKRSTYDQLGPDWQNYQQGSGAGGFSGGFPGGMRMDFGDGDGFSDFFRTIFGGMGASAGSGRRSYRSAGADMEVTLEMSLREAMHAPLHRKMTLRDSDGTTREIDVNLPRGIVNGSKLRLRSQGGAGLGGGPAGDLFVTVRFRQDPLFELEGCDLTVKISVAPWDAVLGGTVAVPTLDGSVNVKVPAGTRGGTRLRLKGRGLPLREAQLSGDLFARVEIDTPDKLSDAQKSLWEQLRALA